MPDAPPQIHVLGELRRSGYASRSVREELQANMLARLRLRRRET